MKGVVESELFDIKKPKHTMTDTRVIPKKADEESFNELHYLVTEEFLRKIKSGEAKTLIKHNENISEISLKTNQGIIFDNQNCLHSRTGPVGDRILLRIWIEKN